jgi:hypothetical protein
MSDYLRRAAERASDVRPEVRPALPSLFDPENAFTHLSPEFGETTNVSPRVEDAPRETERRRESITPMHQRGAAIKALQTELPGASPARDDEKVAPEIHPVVTRKIRAAEIPPSSPSALPSEMPAKKEATFSGERRATSPLQPAPALAPRIEPAASESHFQKSFASAEGPPKLPSVDSTSEQRSVESAIMPKNSGPPAGPKSPVSPLVSALRRDPRRSTPMTPQELLADNDPSSARTIKVTIGRIEVRAVYAAPERPPAPRRPVRPAPKMSLDDYLRSRNGGGK